MEVKDAFKSTMVAINSNFADLRKAVELFTINTDDSETLQLMNEIISWQVQIKRRLCRTLWTFLSIQDNLPNIKSEVNKVSFCVQPGLMSEVLSDVDSMFLSSSQRK